MAYKPLITIILTTFNRAHLIGETLDSIIAQTYANWECIIIDDNSIDNTKEVVQNYLNQEKRFTFFVKGDKYSNGLSASRNMGMDLIMYTDLIQFFDDDDIMHPQKFEIQVKEFIKYHDLDITIFPGISFKDGEKIIIKPIKKEIESNIIKNIGEDFILGKTKFTAQIPLIKYDYIKDIRFNDNLFYAEEWEVFNKLFFLKNTKASFVNSTLFFRRKHDLSITANLYGKKNTNEVSNNQAFINVYQAVKKSRKFNGRIFSRFFNFSIHSKINDDLLKEIKNDLKQGLLSNKIKDVVIFILLHLVKINKKLVIKIINIIAR
jgi:glycosyltransferase involved in cell wall biosynthesis